MSHATRTIRTSLTLALMCALCMAAPPGVLAADPGPPPGIPAAPTPTRTVPDTSDPEHSQRTAAWKRALDDADGPHVDDVLEPRPLAAIIGTVWFLLAVRSRWRSRRSVPA